MMPPEAKPFFFRMRLLLAFELVLFLPLAFLLLITGGVIKPEPFLKIQNAARKRLLLSKMRPDLMRTYYLEYPDFRIAKRLRSRDL